MKRKIVVAGSRNIFDDEMVEKEMLEFIGDTSGQEIIILHGDCNSGVDQSADKVARKHGWAVQKYPADWNKYGKGAGPIRNRQMSFEGEEALIIWDGKSSGSKSMFKEANGRMERVKSVILLTPSK